MRRHPANRQGDAFPETSLCPDARNMSCLLEEYKSERGRAPSRIQTPRQLSEALRRARNRDENRKGVGQREDRKPGLTL